MKHLIDKSALAAEIEKRKKHHKEWLNWCIKNRTSIIAASQSIQEDKDIMSLIDTLDTIEVKEWDLEKEIEEVKHNYKIDDNRHTTICSADIEWLAKHFFELGLKAQKGE